MMSNALSKNSANKPESDAHAIGYFLGCVTSAIIIVVRELFIALFNGLHPRGKSAHRGGTVFRKNRAHPISDDIFNTPACLRKSQMTLREWEENNLTGCSQQASPPCAEHSASEEDMCFEMIYEHDFFNAGEGGHHE